MTAMGNVTFNIKALFRGNPIRWLVVGGALLVAGIVVGTAMMAGVFRERALHSAERELDNTVLLLAHHFDQQLADFVTIQREVARRPSLRRLASPDAFRSLMSTREMHEILRPRAAAIPTSPASTCSTSDGKLINSSERWPAPNVNISDRAFFKAFKSGKAGTPVLIELVHGRFSGGWATVIAHRVTGPERRVHGRRHARDHAGELREVFRVAGARRRRRDLDVPSRRNPAGALPACPVHDRAEF